LKTDFKSLEKQIINMIEEVGFLNDVRNNKKSDHVGLILSNSMIDRIPYFFVDYPDLAIQIQELLKKTTINHTIQSIFRLLVNRKFGNLSVIETIQLGLNIIITLITKAKIDSPVDVVEAALDPNDQTIQLTFYPLITIFPSKDITLLISAIHGLLEDLHLSDSYIIPSETIEEIFKECQNIFPDKLWNMNKSRFDNFLRRLSIKLDIRKDGYSNFNLNSPLVFVLKSLLTHFEDFREASQFFLVQRWDYIFNIKEDQVKDFSINNDKIGLFLERVQKYNPIFSLSNNNEGFRVILGRARNTGYGTAGIHPATIEILNLLAIGNQIILEPPFSPLAIQPVDSINGPLVKLVSNKIVRIKSYNDYSRVKNDILLILSLGDILIDFNDINSFEIISQTPYTNKEWESELIRWFIQASQEKRKKCLDILGIKTKKTDITHKKAIEMLKRINLSHISIKAALIIAQEFQLSLHPFWIPQWDYVTTEEWNRFKTCLLSAKIEKKTYNGQLLVFTDHIGYNIEKFFIRGGIEYSKENNKLILDKWGLLFREMFLKQSDKLRNIEPPPVPKFRIIPFLSQTFNIQMKEVRGRRIKAALGETHTPHRMQTKTKLHGFYPSPQTKSEFDHITTTLTEMQLFTPVDSLSLLNKDVINKFPKLESEPLNRVLLRAKYGLTVHKDGIIHLSVPNAPLSQFKAKEIKTSLTTLQDFGYYYDCNGAALQNNNQLINLKPTDVILSEKLIPDLLNTYKFIKEELSLIGKELGSIKNIDQNDLLGELIIGINNNFSVGVPGRIIGFTEALVCFAQSAWHASKGSRCSGSDSDSIILAWDCILNFHPKHLLPKIGIFRGVPLFIQSIPIKEEFQSTFLNLSIDGSIPPYLQIKKRRTQRGNFLKLLSKYENNFSLQYLSLKPTISYTTSAINLGTLSNILYKVDNLSIKLHSILKLTKKLAGVNTTYLLSHYYQKYLVGDLLKILDDWVEGIFYCDDCHKTITIDFFEQCPFCNGKVRNKVNVERIKEQYRLINKLKTYYNGENIPPRINDLFNYIDIQMTLLVDVNEKF
jgi:DNA polymerase II large subunit